MLPSGTNKDHLFNGHFKVNPSRLCYLPKSDVPLNTRINWRNRVRLLHHTNDIKSIANGQSDHVCDSGSHCWDHEPALVCLSETTASDGRPSSVSFCAFAFLLIFTRDTNLFISFPSYLFVFSPFSSLPPRGPQTSESIYS